MNTDDAATVVRKLRVMAAEAISHSGRAARSKSDAELLLQAARYVTWAESADAATAKVKQFSTVRRLHQAIDRVEPAPALDGTA